MPSEGRAVRCYAASVSLRKRPARGRPTLRRPRIRALAILAATWAAAACGSRARDERPDVLVVTLDTTRADHLGTYGYFRDTSPELDALARKSLVFDHALAPMATTLPSHLSMFTATAPLEHGVLANTTQGGDRFVVSATLRPIAAIAAEAGYQTAGFVSAAPLKRGSGIEAGFQVFDQPREKQRDGADLVAVALRWLAEADDRPVFAWVHFYDAHWPHEVPPSQTGHFATDDRLERHIAERRIPARAPRPLTGTVDVTRPTINAYDAELRHQDAELGRLLRGFGDERGWERTAVLVIGDHGEGLCQHFEAGHGSTWHEQLRVPLLMRVPGTAPRRIETPLSITDAMPTFLALLKVPGLALPAGQASGRDVLAPDAKPAPILSQDTGREREGPYRYALTSGRWKYFRIEEAGGSVREALYDLETDPHELTDVAAAHPEQAASLRELLVGRLREQLARGESLRSGRPAETRPIDPETQQQLEALGYATGEEGP